MSKPQVTLFDLYAVAGPSYAAVSGVANIAAMSTQTRDVGL